MFGRRVKRGPWLKSTRVVQHNGMVHDHGCVVRLAKSHETDELAQQQCGTDSTHVLERLLYHPEWREFLFDFPPFLYKTGFLLNFLSPLHCSGVYI